MGGVGTVTVSPRRSIMFVLAGMAPLRFGLPGAWLRL